MPNKTLTQASLALALGLGVSSAFAGAAYAQRSPDAKLEQNRVPPTIGAVPADPSTAEPATAPDTLAGRVAPEVQHDDPNPGINPSLTENSILAPTQTRQAAPPVSITSQAQGNAYNKATSGPQDDAVSPPVSR